METQQPMKPFSEEQYLTGTRRLQILEQHLRSGELAHQNFDFSCYNSIKGEEFQLPGNKCGTNGCAIGEMPKIWPDSWTWMNNGVYPRGWMMDNGWIARLEHVLNWFAITSDEHQHLFYPESQCPKLYGGEELSDFSTREEVADNMLAFIHKCREKYMSKL